MDIAVVTKSIRVYKDYEVRLLEVQNVRVGGAMGGAVGKYRSSKVGGAMGGTVGGAVGGAVSGAVGKYRSSKVGGAVGGTVGGAVGSLRRVNRDVEG